MDNHIYILGDIGRAESGGLDLSYVKSQYDSDSKKVIVHIASDGGEVDEGFAIMDFLLSIPQHVHTIGEGMVASIATMPFLAGNTREMRPNAQFLGHLPSIHNFSGNADDYERAAEYMVEIRRRIASVYSRFSGGSVEDMEDFMRKDTPIFPEKTQQMGFATQISEFKAVAKLNINNIQMAEEKEEGKKPSRLEEIANKMTNFLDSLSGDIQNNSPSNRIFNLKDGVKMFVNTEDDEIENKKAFKVKEDGTSSEEVLDKGSYIDENGKAFNVSDSGVISFIGDEEEKEEKIEKKELEALNKKLEEANSKIENLSKELSESQKDKKEGEEKLLNIENKLDEIMSRTIGGKPTVAKANVKNVNKNTVTHSLDGFAGKFRK